MTVRRTTKEDRVTYEMHWMRLCVVVLEVYLDHVVVVQDVRSDVTICGDIRYSNRRSIHDSEECWHTRRNLFFWADRHCDSFDRIVRFVGSHANVVVYRRKNFSPVRRIEPQVIHKVCW
jgi:hypothetical protein